MRFQDAWMDPLAGVEDRGNKIHNRGLVPYEMGRDTLRGRVRFPGSRQPPDLGSGFQDPASPESKKPTNDGGLIQSTLRAAAAV
jgi:hypothetical protein